MRSTSLYCLTIRGLRQIRLGLALARNSNWVPSLPVQGIHKFSWTGLPFMGIECCLIMAYLGVVLFLISVNCKGLLFWRAWRWGGWRAYPLFYVYLCYTSFWAVAFLFFAHAHPLYPRVYWDSEVVAAAFRFFVAWEVFRSVFRPGTVRRIAGTALVVVLVLLALAFWLSGPSPGASPVIDFMRKMALSAGTWIVLVLGVARFYGIGIGRNTWGMAIGFLIFVSSEVANFAAHDLSPSFIPIWRVVHPFAYVLMLTVWVWSLWDYAPNPQNQIDSSLGSHLLSKWERQSAALDETIRKVMQR
jgi:hypothetical protein